MRTEAEQLSAEGLVETRQAPAENGHGETVVPANGVPDRRTQALGLFHVLTDELVDRIVSLLAPTEVMALACCSRCVSSHPCP